MASVRPSGTTRIPNFFSLFFVNKFKRRNKAGLIKKRRCGDRDKEAEGSFLFFSSFYMFFVFGCSESNYLLLCVFRSLSFLHILLLLFLPFPALAAK